jgi:hypothetical protein
MQVNAEIHEEELFIQLCTRILQKHIIVELCHLKAIRIDKILVIRHLALLSFLVALF